MSFFEWWASLELAAQVFYCIAVPATLVLIVQTVLMLFGSDDSPDADVDPDLPDADLPEDIIGDDVPDDIPDDVGLGSLNILTLRGIIAFFVVFGWVGAVMQSSGVNIYITVPVALACGIAIMIAIAYMFRAVMRLRSDGTADNRNAVGSSGKVYLTIPEKRTGEGKVQFILQGAFVERNAVTDEETAIPTGCEVIIVGLSGGTTLVVKRK